MNPQRFDNQYPPGNQDGRMPPNIQQNNDGNVSGMRRLPYPQQNSGSPVNNNPTENRRLPQQNNGSLVAGNQGQYGGSPVNQQNGGSPTNYQMTNNGPSTLQKNGQSAMINNRGPALPIQNDGSPVNNGPGQRGPGISQQNSGPPGSGNRGQASSQQNGGFSMMNNGLGNGQQGLSQRSGGSPMNNPPVNRGPGAFQQNNGSQMNNAPVNRGPNGPQQNGASQIVNNNPANRGPGGPQQNGAPQMMNNLANRGTGGLQQNNAPANMGSSGSQQNSGPQTMNNPARNRGFPIPQQNSESSMASLTSGNIGNGTQQTDEHHPNEDQGGSRGQLPPQANGNGGHPAENIQVRNRGPYNPQQQNMPNIANPMPGGQMGKQPTPQQNIELSMLNNPSGQHSNTDDGHPSSANNQTRGHLTLNNQKGNLMKDKVQGVMDAGKAAEANTTIPKYLDTKASEDKVQKLREALKKSDTICAVFSLLGIVLAFIDEEIFFNNGLKNSWKNNGLRTLITFTSVFVVGFIWRHYMFELEILKAKKIVYQTTSILNSGMLGKLIFEGVFSFVHLPPLVEVSIDNYQLGHQFEVSLNAYFTFAMLFRLYVIFRLFDHYTFWTGPRSVRVCKINGFKADSVFAIKAYLKYRAFTILVFGLGLSILIFGLAVRLFEKPYIRTVPGTLYVFNFDSVWNSFWCMIVTMCTIGYGDIYPSTHLGRLVTICACIWGTFLLSLFVVALNNFIEFSKEESQAFDEMNKNQLINKKLSKDAYLLLQTFLRLKLLQKNKSSLKDRFLMRIDMVSLAARYKIKRKSVLTENKSVSDILQEMQDDEEYGVEELINLLAPVKDITHTVGISSVEHIEETQNEINAKVLEAHKMSKKLFNLIIAMNNGEAGHLKSINDFNTEYSISGEKVEEKTGRSPLPLPPVETETDNSDSNTDDSSSPGNRHAR